MTSGRGIFFWLTLYIHHHILKKPPGQNEDKQTKAQIQQVVGDKHQPAQETESES